MNLTLLFKLPYIFAFVYRFKRDSVITSEIRTIIRSDFPGPYRNWSTTPQHVKERWWFTFKVYHKTLHIQKN